MGSGGWVPPGYTEGDDAGAPAPETTPPTGAAWGSSGAAPRLDDPPPGGVHWGPLIAVMAIALVVFAAVVAAVTALAGGDGAGGDEAAESEERDDTEDPEVTTTLPDPAPPGHRTATAQDGSFTLVLPENWTMTILRGNALVIARELYEETGRLPDAAQAMVDSHQCPACHSIAIDPTRESATGMPTTVTVEKLTNFAFLGLDGAVATFQGAPTPVGSLSGATGRLTAPAGEMSWLDFTLPDQGVVGRHYFLVVGADLWHLTYLDPYGGPDRSPGAGSCSPSSSCPRSRHSRSSGDDVIRVARNREPGVRITDIAADFGISESWRWRRQVCPSPAPPPGRPAAGDGQ